MDLTTTIIWIYSFGLGMVVGIFGIATGSMVIAYAKIQTGLHFSASKIKQPILSKTKKKVHLLQKWTYSVKINYYRYDLQ